MRLGDIANAAALGHGKPLDGVRVLALEQMQALPFATQLLARLGAEVVKVEHPKGGDLGRGSQPAMLDPDGRAVGATFLRNNLDKRSITVDLKHPKGKELILGRVMASAAQALPPSAFDMLDQVVNDVVLSDNAPGLISMGGVLALWAGSNIFSALIDALNRAYDVIETKLRRSASGKIDGWGLKVFPR